MHGIEAVQWRKGEGANCVHSRLYDAVAIVRRDSRATENLLTDLSSVPWTGWSLVSRVGPHLEASIVRDWLYIAWQRQRKEPRRRCAEAPIHRVGAACNVMAAPPKYRISPM